MNKLVENTIENLRHYTKSFTDELDKIDCPIHYDLVTEQQYTYVLHGIEHHNYTDKSFLFLAKRVPYTYGYENHNFELNFADMINDDLIQPMLIFINGEFIPWSRITVIRDCNYSYFKISDMYTTQANISCILLPRNMIYKENAIKSDLTKNTYFVFDKNGKLRFDFRDPHIIVDIPDIYCEYFTISDGARYKTSLSAEYLVNTDSIFVFNNGVFNYKDKCTNEGLNVISVDNVLDNDMIVFSNKTKNGEKDNINIVPNKAYITNKLINPPITDNFKSILKRFDFDYTRNKTYENNLLDSLKYIMNYNPNLMKDSYKSLCNIEFRYYTGAELRKLADDKNYVTLSRMINKNINNQLIIFKNGMLYEAYNSLYINRGREFVFKLLTTVLDTDKFELMYIKNTNNFEYPLYLYSLKEDNTYPLNPDFDLKDSKLFCRDHYNKKFSIKTSENIQYEVPFKYEVKGNGEVKFILNDPWYYDKDLTLVSGRDFRYTHIVTDKKIGGHLLPVDFRFANDISRYMIFLNGRRLDKENYKLTMVDPTRPFTNIAVYFNLLLEIGDTIDIFYLPDSMDEVLIKPEIENNTVLINNDAIKYGLDKDIYMIFVNGKKLNPDQIVNVSSTIIMVKNVESIYNLSIVKYIKDIDILSEMFNDSDTMSTFVGNLTTSQFDNTFDNAILQNSDPGLNRNTISNKAVIYEIIKDFYDKPYINLGDLFVYNYEEDPNLIKDKDGNIIFNLTTLE